MPHELPDRRRTHPFAIAGIVLVAVDWSLPGRPIVRDGVYLNLVAAVFCGSLAAILSLLVLLKEKSDTASRLLAWLVLALSSPFFCCFALSGVSGFIMIGR